MCQHTLSRPPARKINLAQRPAGLRRPRSHVGVSLLAVQQHLKKERRFTPSHTNTPRMCELQRHQGCSPCSLHQAWFQTIQCLSGFRVSLPPAYGIWKERHANKHQFRHRYTYRSQDISYFLCHRACFLGLNSLSTLQHHLASQKPNSKAGHLH